MFFFGISIFSLSLATGVALLLRLTVQPLIAVLVWCFVASPSLLLASVVFHALSEGRLLKKGCFEVSILPLSYKQEVSAHGLDISPQKRYTVKRRTTDAPLFARASIGPQKNL